LKSLLKYTASFGRRTISGGTIADLARDGMLALTTINRLASAQLTERGKWFARTLLRDAVPADRESLLSSSPLPSKQRPVGTG
jgi:hypothetical protein